MNLVTKEEMEKLARLSHLEAREALFAQLNSVVEYAARVQEIRKEKLAQESVREEQNIVRQDKVQATDPKYVLAQAPQTEGHYFVVPMILEQS